MKNKLLCPLNQLTIGQSCRIHKISLAGLTGQRLLSLGMIPGTLVHCLRRSPFGNPTAYELRGTILSLRNEDAARITVTPVTEAEP